MMRLKLFILSLAVILLSAWSAAAQNLSSLPGRASKLWEFRAQSNKLEAMQLVDPQTRQVYLQWNEAPILEFKVSGLEFSDDPNRIDVLVKVRSVLPQLGEISRTVRETWIWKDGDWFMHALAPPDLFSDGEDRPGPAVRLPPDFQLTTKVLDVGRHSQGETVQGKIEFRANRDDIVIIRPLQSVSGFSIGSAVWTSPSEGYLPYTWQTTLVWQDVNQTIPLEAVGRNDALTSVDLQLKAQIDGKIGFKQVPEVIDPSKEDGQVQLWIQNFSTKPLQFLSVVSHNSNYVVNDDVPESIAPGESGRFQVYYAQQTAPAGASIALILSEQLGPSPVINLPINVKLPDVKRTSFTPEELKRLADKARAQAPKN